MEQELRRAVLKTSLHAPYLHVFPKLLQEHFLVLLVNVYLLPIIDEVIVLVGGQLLSLFISVGD